MCLEYVGDAGNGTVVIKNVANEPLIPLLFFILTQEQRANLVILGRENDSVDSPVLPSEKGGTERAYRGGVALLCEYLFVRGGCAEETDENGCVGRGDWVWVKSNYVGSVLG